VNEGLDALPYQLCIVTDKGRSSKEQGNLVVKEAVAAMMNSWQSPFRPMQDANYAGLLEASGRDVGHWLLSDAFEEHLFGYFPCANITPSKANKVSPITPAGPYSASPRCLSTRDARTTPLDLTTIRFSLTR